MCAQASPPGEGQGCGDPRLQSKGSRSASRIWARTESRSPSTSAFGEPDDADAAAFQHPRSLAIVVSEALMLFAVQLRNNRANSWRSEQVRNIATAMTTRAQRGDRQRPEQQLARRILRVAPRPIGPSHSRNRPVAALPGRSPDRRNVPRTGQLSLDCGASLRFQLNCSLCHAQTGWLGVV